MGPNWPSTPGWSPPSPAEASLDNGEGNTQGQLWQMLAGQRKERTQNSFVGDDVSSWWWQWRWGGDGAGKLRPSSGHWPMLVAEPCQHHCDKQQRKHTSLAARGCSQTWPKRPSPAVSSSKTLSVFHSGWGRPPPQRSIGILSHPLFGLLAPPSLWTWHSCTSGDWPIYKQSAVPQHKVCLEAKSGTRT